MKNFLVIATFLISFLCNAQSVLGKWKTIDDKTGQAKSVVEIYENNGKIFGKVIEIFDATKRNAICDKCSGIDKNKPVLGLIIIKGLTKDGNEYSGGKIIDPQTGSIYKCILKIEKNNTLEVRGYVGISFVGRSQFWERVK